MTAPEFRYPFRLRDAFQDTRNNTELEIFLNTFAVLKDENGDVSIDGDLSLAGVFTDVGATYNSGAEVDGSLTAAVGVYQTIASLTLGDAGDYIIWARLYLEASISALVRWTIRLNPAIGSVFAFTRAAHDGATAGTVVLIPVSFFGHFSSSVNAQDVSLQVSRNPTSGTQIWRNAQLEALRVS